MDKLETRAQELFGRAHSAIADDFQGMFADHSAKGRLGSGTTIIRAIEIFRRRMSEALTQIQTEVGGQVEHRGRRWRAANRAVLAALEHATQGREAMFADVVLLSRAEGAAERVMNERLDEVVQDLRRQLSEFAEGWTAPRPRGWHERHPVFYAAISALVGAGLTLVLTHLAG